MVAYTVALSKWLKGSSAAAADACFSYLRVLTAIVWLSLCSCRLRKAVKQLLQEAHAASQAAGQALDASLAAKLGSTKLLKDELAAQVSLLCWHCSSCTTPILLLEQATCMPCSRTYCQMLLLCPVLFEIAAEQRPR